MKRFAANFVRIFGVILLFTLSVTSLTELSPVYDFAEPVPFDGPDIFDPYSGIDSTIGWKRSNFHTHTKVTGPFNECPGWPDEVYEDYKSFRYDILTFSNHNELTVHPVDSALQVNVYEHGYNIFKYHKLVFNPSRMVLHDVFYPFTASQRQFVMDYLARNADFVVLNHPDRTTLTTPGIMRKLSGYRLVEADCGVSTELAHWDEALSAGHYSFCITDDDCHDSGNHSRIARRCNWLNSPSDRYADIRATLLSGRFYSMRIPDFGDGDWDVKREENAKLPKVLEIGLSADTVRLALSEPAALIKATGQDHTLLDAAVITSEYSYVFRPEDRYVRLTAYFANGVVLYTNAWARYDASVSDSPFAVAPHGVNVPLTVLFNLAVLAVAFFSAYLAVRIIRQKRRENAK